MKKRRLKWLGCTLCLLLLALNASSSMQSLRRVPRDLYFTDSEDLAPLYTLQPPFSMENPASHAAADLSERLREAGAPDTSFRISLFDVIPVREVRLHYRPEIRVMPGGQSIGVAMYMQGALVVGLGSFMRPDGVMVSPAQRAGVQAGDVILKAAGETVQNAAHLVMLCERTEGALPLEIRRGEELLTLRVVPEAAAEDGVHKLGMWVRDSTAGIGTLSFYDMAQMRFGALGHPVTDIDLGSMLQIEGGEIMQADVVGVSSGLQGVPGELHGAFHNAGETLGALRKNTRSGIFGDMDKPLANPLYPDGVRLAYPDELHTGTAELLATVDENGVCAFSCEIVKLYPQQSANSKGMVIHITDEALLGATGGIVQGMSGSPLIQDGKLAGVVTHVFVNDPTRGYAIYALWMYEEALGE